MKRVFAAIRVALPVSLLALAFAPALGACDGHDHFRDDGSGYGGEADCAQATSCGTCTPIVGCGWCATPSGEGACVADPNACAAAPSFSWTWDPSGCRESADASVVSSTDSATSTTADDAGTGTATADTGIASEDDGSIK